MDMDSSVSVVHSVVDDDGMSRQVIHLKLVLGSRNRRGAGVREKFRNEWDSRDEMINICRGWYNE